MEEVALINGIRDKSKIQVGQRIFIPGVATVLKVDFYVEDVTVRGDQQPSDTETENSCGRSRGP